ncbi:MAG: hypothetical protein WCD88_09485 [Desulfobacterales bacterium]
MKRWVLLALLMGLTAGGCTEAKNRTTGVYLLLDTRAADALARPTAQSAVNCLLGILQPTDTLALAGIATGSFSEKDIVASTTFDRRPSVANQQKRAFQKKAAHWLAAVKGSAETDVTGGILQAIEYLNAKQAGRKVILIVSDLTEERVRSREADVSFQLSDFLVILLNPAAGRSEIHPAANAFERIERWRAKVESGNGTWRVIEDIQDIDAVFTH